MKENNQRASAEGGLKRQLNPMHVWAIAFGCVVGWGSFINPGKSSCQTPAWPEQP